MNDQENPRFLGILLKSELSNDVTDYNPTIPKKEGK